MKNAIIVFGFLLAVSLSAQIQQWELNRFRERIAIAIDSLEDLRQLKAADIEIDRCSGIYTNLVYAYATPQEVELVTNMGFKVRHEPVTIGQDCAEVAYHTYESLTQELQQLASQYSQIAQLYSIGKSIQGRELWIMKISDNVVQDEPEPEVKFISSMHGDEVVGQELMVYLIRYLLENYQKDAWITQLIEDVEIWIMPSMNPDGTALRRRYNANWVDLNRNFPDPQDDPNNNPQGRAIETQHLMNFTSKHNFILSLNFHGGALVVNYPWDTMPGDVPDIALTKYVSLGYSKRNTPMYNSTQFTNGITNGYDWYEVNGGMQDWNYHWYTDLDLTIEVSTTKWPDASTLPKYWQDNRDSLLWFLSQARRGVQGIVTDAKTGKPLNAQIQVAEIDKPISTSPLHGGYHRVLLPGTYSLRFSANGYGDIYHTVEIADSDTQATILHVALTPSK